MVRLAKPLTVAKPQQRFDPFIFRHRSCSSSSIRQSNDLQNRRLYVRFVPGSPNLINMYLVLATYTEAVPNPYYFPGAGRTEPETIKQDKTRVLEFKSEVDLTEFMKRTAPYDYHTIRYFEASEVFPELVQTVKVSFK